MYPIEETHVEVLSSFFTVEYNFSDSGVWWFWVAKSYALISPDVT